MHENYKIKLVPVNRRKEKGALHRKLANAQKEMIEILRGKK